MLLMSIFEIIDILPHFQVNSELAKKTAEIKALQRRFDVAKAEADQAKAQGKSNKASMDQVWTLTLDLLTSATQSLCLPKSQPKPCLEKRKEKLIKPFNLVNLQANAALSKSQEEARALNKKLNDARLQKEEAVRELEQARAEQKMIFAELKQLQQSQQGNGAGQAAGSRRKMHYNADAPFPRVAFSTKVGWASCVNFEYDYSTGVLKIHFICLF